MRPARADAQWEDRVRAGAPAPTGARRLNWTPILLVLAIAALVLPVVFTLRRPILFRMAVRNAMRRGRQSAMIAAGLMVGTAIVAGAQVAGDSMGFAIKKATLDAFELIDETVFLDGYNFFPQRVETALSADAALVRETDAIGSNIIWDASATSPRTGLYEPSVRMVGFDPEADLDWGSFRTSSGPFDGRSLRADEVVINRELADRLDARVGDAFIVNFTLPQDPLFPSFQNYSGVLNVSVTGPALPPPIPSTAEPIVAEIPFRVDRSAVRLNVALNWPFVQGQAQDLDLELESPISRTTYHNRNGTSTAPDRPAFLFLNQSIADPLEQGTWKLRVHGKAAVQTPFNGTIVTVYAVYNLTELQQRVANLQRQFPNFDPRSLQESEPESATFRIAAITDGGKGPNFQLPNRLTFFARLSELQRLLDREAQVNFVKVSNPGGVQEGAAGTDHVYPILWDRLNATKELFPRDPSIQYLRANNDKQFWLAQAEEVGQLFGVFLTFVGSFSIIAGLLLIINIFTMLAEERKVELAMARAVGLRRGHLVQLFTIEGVLYALPAAIVGAFFGLGLAAVLIWGFNAFGDATEFPPIPFVYEPESLVFAFSVGILLTVGTIVLGARRVSRLNVVAAIRNLDEPPHVRGASTLVGAILLTSAGVAGTLYALLTDSFTWQLLGPTFLALGLGFILRRFARKEHVYPYVALGLFVYLTATLFTIKAPENREADVMGPVRSVIMTLCVVIYVVYTERLTRLLGYVAARIPPLRAIAIPAVSYPLHKKFRTGMTLAMFSVILLVVMLFSIFGTLFATDWQRESGGYHVEARSGSSFETLTGHGADPRVLDGVIAYSVLPYFVRFGADIIRVNNESTGQFGAPQNAIYGIDAAFAEQSGFTLINRLPRFASDKAAYAAVASDPRLVIVSYEYSTSDDGRDGAFKAGDSLTLIAKGAESRFTIAGVMEQYHFRGIFISKSQVSTLFPNTDTLVLFRLQDPNLDDEAAKRIEANYKDLGLDASAIRTKVLEENENFRQIFTLIRLFLSLGLIVGILSLGIVTARSVIERRQEIGMMRALGYLRRHIRRTFLMEMLTTVGLGIGIGTAVAVLVSYAIWYAELQDLRIPYTVPWGELGLIAAIAFVVTTLATLSPILRAARTQPAEALRYIE